MLQNMLMYGTFALIQLYPVSYSIWGFRNFYSSNCGILDLNLKSATNEKWSEAYAKLGTLSADICSPLGKSSTFSTSTSLQTG